MRNSLKRNAEPFHLFLRRHHSKIRGQVRMVGSTVVVQVREFLELFTKDT
jgi:hypothetical protein